MDRRQEQLRLRERDAIAPPTPGAAGSGEGHRYLEQLATSYLGGTARLDRFLGLSGLTRERAAYLCRPAAVPGRPAPPRPARAEPPTTGRPGHPLSQLHRRFAAELEQALEGIDTAMDHRRLIQAVSSQFARNSEELAVAAIVLEMQIAKPAGRIPEQFYRSYLLALQAEECASIFRTYAVLERLLIDRFERELTVNVELLGRLARDRTAIAATFAIGQDDPAVSVVAPGDAHHGGRRTAVLQFGSGARVVYKPRPMASARLFGDLVDWLGKAGYRPLLRSPRVLAVDGYGWSEWIEHRPCANRAEAREYFRRMGALSALMFVLDAADLHLENVIAAGDHPVVIDLETLLHNNAPTPWLTPLADTVVRSGLLPLRYTGRAGSADLSAIGGRGGQPAPHFVRQWTGIGTSDMRLGPEETAVLGESHNSPVLDGVDVRPQDHVEELLDGLRSCLGFLASRRGALLKRLSSAGDLEMRHVIRPTAEYVELLQHGRHPTVLRDAVERECYFAARLLRSGEVSADEVVRAELDALWGEDVPLFTCRPSSRDLTLEDGTVVPAYFARSSLDRVTDRLDGLTAATIARQEYCARLSVEVGDAHGPPPAPTRGAVPTTPTTLTELVEEALAIGERLSVLAIASDGQLAWPAVLADSNDYYFGTSGGDLYLGNAGIAVFLAYLARATDEPSYADLARRAIGTAADQVRRSRLTLGAFSSAAGLLLAASHVSHALGDPALLWNLGSDLPPPQQLEHLIDHDTTFDLMAGSAGTLLVLLGLPSASTYPTAAAVAERAAQHLARQATRTPAGASWTAGHAERPLLGISHGTTGIALALARYAQFRGDRHVAELALNAFAFGDSHWDEPSQNWPDFRSDPSAPQFTNAWCHGAPGEIAGRWAGHRALDDPSMTIHLADAVTQVLRRGLGGNDSLCHGDLGNLECLAPYTDDLHPDLGATIAANVAAALRRRQQQGSWVCGVAGGLETPGLFVGLAGIGLTLLRTADPSIPSLLTAEGPTRPWWA